MLVGILGSQTFNPGNWHSRFKVGLGLDLSSGTEVVLKAATTNGTAPSAAAMQQAISVLESRVNGTGNSGAQVQQQGSDLINVTVPGKAANDVINLVSSTAKLAFRPVLLEQPFTGATVTPSPSPSPSGSASPSSSSSPSASKSASPSTKAASTSASPKASTQDVSAKLASPSATATASSSATASATPTASSTAKASATPTPTPTSSSSTTFGNASKVNAATMKLFNKLVCKPGPNSTTVNDNWKKSVGYTEAGDQWDKLTSQTVSCDPNGTKYVLGPAVFEGTQLTGVTAALQSNSTQWVVNLTLNGEATRAFGTLTTNQFNNFFPGTQQGNQNDAALDSTAIVLDGNVQSAPETQAALTSGQFTISSRTSTRSRRRSATAR
jgi:preprotein translocase subunit SecD